MRYKTLAACCAVGTFSIALDVYGEPPASVDAGHATADACALLSPGAISQVIGFSVQPGVRRDSGYEPNGSYSSTCVWIIERERSTADRDAPLGGRSFVILNVMRWPEGSGLADTFLQAFYDAAEKGELPDRPTPRDFGDAALWWGDGLAVRKGDLSFGISVVMPDVNSRSPGEIEEQLVPEILRRLEQRG